MPRAGRAPVRDLLRPRLPCPAACRAVAREGGKREEPLRFAQWRAYDLTILYLLLAYIYYIFNYTLKYYRLAEIMGIQNTHA